MMKDPEMEEKMQELNFRYKMDKNVEL